MKFNVLTLFPEMIEDTLSHSIMKKAMEKNLIELNAVNIRDFTTNKHLKVDDYTYGGGAGMLMQAEPVYKAYESLNTKSKVVFLTPRGKTFNQELAKELAKEDEITFLCGHYEGIDERVLEEIVDEEISIGDYVLTGGELAACVVIDAVARLKDGVLGKTESHEEESFSNNLLEYPQYTRPEVWHDKKVPDVLMSGHHANIEKWRLEESIKLTKKNRPDLYEKYEENKMN
ncbi:MAG: tRNA (guanosine(37)-N1)-methyltransferase TrmD [Clostridia bacterium]|jgi:tRNA (guanine37-N1)-methyltransferase|nr:tRNA (guanosine(37)-N1)-methyltransferase TrmD [Clostridia bacterium]